MSMHKILELYQEYSDWINLIKDLAFLAGAITFIKAAFTFFEYFKNRHFLDTTAIIDRNLNFRSRLEALLEGYIFKKAVDIKDISIRFIHWKNYPQKLDKDGYKHLLNINYFENKPHYGWIDNTGVYFEEPIWNDGSSIYIDKNKIFFFDRKGKNHKGFEEIADVRIVFHMPFSNIINYDFKELVEYEPVFYTKYKYTDRNNLYNDTLSVRERQGSEYKCILLSQSKRIVRFSLLSYKVMQLKVFCKRRKNKTD